MPSDSCSWPFPNEFGQTETVESEVLVLGGGLSGCFAAIAAARRGRSVVIVEKGATLRSGAGGTGFDHWESACTNPCSKVTPEEIAGFRNNGPNVNWVRSLYDDWSPQHSHSVSMTGGTDKLSYMASIGYLDQDSMFKGSKDYGYKRFNARMNLSHKVTDRLTINLTSQFARNTITDHAYDTYWIVEQANRMPPIYDIKNPDGTYAYPSGSNANGLQRIEQGGYTQSVNDELAGTLSAEWELFDGFKLIGSIGARTWNNGKHTQHLLPLQDLFL